MASTTASAGSERMVHRGNTISKEQISDSLGRLSGWLKWNDHRYGKCVRARPGTDSDTLYGQPTANEWIMVIWPCVQCALG